MALTPHSLTCRVSKPPSSPPDNYDFVISDSKLWNALLEKTRGRSIRGTGTSRGTSKSDEIWVCLSEIGGGRSGGKKAKRQGLIGRATFRTEGEREGEARPYGSDNGKGRGVSSDVQCLITPTFFSHHFSFFRRALSSTSTSNYPSYPYLSSSPSSSSSEIIFTLSLTPISPIPLTQVFLQALSNRAFNFDQDRIEKWLTSPPSSSFSSSSSLDDEDEDEGYGKLLHQNEILQFSPSTSSSSEGPHYEYKYRVLLTEPVLQGVVKTGVTGFVIIPPPLVQSREGSGQDESGSDGDDEEKEEQEIYRKNGQDDDHEEVSFQHWSQEEKELGSTLPEQSLSSSRGQQERRRRRLSSSSSTSSNGGGGGSGEIDGYHLSEKESMIVDEYEDPRLVDNPLVNNSLINLQQKQNGIVNGSSISNHNHSNPNEEEEEPNGENGESELDTFPQEEGVKPVWGYSLSSPVGDLRGLRRAGGRNRLGTNMRRGMDGEGKSRAGGKEEEGRVNGFGDGDEKMEDGRGKGGANGEEDADGDADEEEKEDDSWIGFVRSIDLAKLGIWNGDWVILRNEKTNLTKIIKVYGHDLIFNQYDDDQDEGGDDGEGRYNRMPGLSSPIPPILLPPLLHHSLFPLPHLTSTSSPLLSIQPLSPAPSSSSPTPSNLPPPFPTARSVTIARLSTPISINKRNQNGFLKGLRGYFESVRRRVVVGLPSNSGGGDGKDGREGMGSGSGEGLVVVGIREAGVEGEEDEEGERFEFPSFSNDTIESLSPSTQNALVFFQVIDIQPDLSSSFSKSRHPSHSLPIWDRISRGEFGCYVDPNVTKMVQTGVERGLVPELGMGDWVGAESSLPPPPKNPKPNSLFSNLTEHVSTTLQPNASLFGLNFTVLLKGNRGCGKSTVGKWVGRKLGMGVMEINCYDLLAETDVKTEGQLRARIDQASSCSPCVLILKQLEALAKKSQEMESGMEPAMVSILSDCFDQLRENWKKSGWPVVVMGTTSDVDKIPTGIVGLFKHEVTFEAPGEEDRVEILRNLVRNDVLALDVSLKTLAIQTAALVATDLVDLVSRVRARSVERALKICSTHPQITPTDVSLSGLALSGSDFSSALEKARSSYSESIGAPKIPNVTWDDVGGLANVKTEILDTIQLPLQHPELFADGLKKRSGILLYGPPGTGKTLLAKAVATSCSLNFFSVKGPELLNMYIGESEANVRRVFQKARDAKPCVIFFDELDSVAPKRGNQGDSGGVMDRIVAQLLAELDGMAEGKGGSDVFVIGATNRPDLLDPALLRPGRFDRMLYLGVSDTHDAQLRIIQALTRKFRLDPNVDLLNITRLCPFNYTGADFYALCSDSMLKAMSRKAEEVDQKIAKMNMHPPYSTGQQPHLTPQHYLSELATPSDIEVLVAQVDFESALRDLTPSVSAAELSHYAKVKERFARETMNKTLPEDPAKVISDIEAEPPIRRADKGKGKAVE